MIDEQHNWIANSIGSMQLYTKYVLALKAVPKIPFQENSGKTRGKNATNEKTYKYGGKKVCQ